MKFGRFVALAVACTVAAVTIAPGCGNSDDGTPTDNGGAPDGSSDAATCANGSSCGDGGTCVANTCCEHARICGDACCSGEEFCSFGRCLAPGATCADSSDCPTGQYCEYTLGQNDAGTPPPASDASCSGGATTLAGRCLPTPPLCAADAGAPSNGVYTCLEKCEHHTTGQFTPSLRFAWGGQVAAPFSTDVMMAPIVIELDDDNCDGKVNAEDIPEIVFSTFTNGDYTHNGTLHAISIVKGAVVEKWSRPGEVLPYGQLAGGNIDGVPGNEVVACTVDGYVRAYSGNGTPLWTSDAMVPGCTMPSLADLDGDGTVEVIVEGKIFSGASGKTKASFASTQNFVISDIDGNGTLDIVTVQQAFDVTGKIIADTGVPPINPGFINGVAIGDLDKDGKPEVIAVDSSAHTVSFWHFDASTPTKTAWMRQNVDINGTLVQHCADTQQGFTHGGGPPTVADFDGDGVPDVALAGGIGYAVLSGAKIANAAIASPNTLLWATPTTDCSSAATGSSVFDFDGDGKAEVVYSDENHLRIYEGPTGKVLFETCNTTGTLIEYPLVADVDNDGHADIVVVSNSYANVYPEYQCNDGVNISQAGVHVFGDLAGSWVRTRRVWNEHAYHITNVEEDGTIPQHELTNWTQPGLNNFRQNKEPGSEFAAADAIVSLKPHCGDPYALVATVTNIGEAALPSGAVVGFYTGAPSTGTQIGTATTTRTLFPAQSEDVTLVLATPPPGVKEGSVTVYAVFDDTKTPHPSWQECRLDNNTTPAVSGECAVIR